MKCANCFETAPIEGSISNLFDVVRLTEDYSWRYVSPCFVLCKPCWSGPLSNRHFMRLHHFPCLVCYEHYDTAHIMESSQPSYLHEFVDLADGVHQLDLDTGAILYADKDNPIYNTPRPGGPRTISLGGTS